MRKRLPVLALLATSAVGFGQALTVSLAPGSPTTFTGSQITLTAQATDVGNAGLIQVVGIGVRQPNGGAADFNINAWVWDGVVDILTANAHLWPRATFASACSNNTSQGGITISACALAISAHTVSFTVTIARDLNLWPGNTEIFLTAYDGTNYSQPWMATVAAWNATAALCSPSSQQSANRISRTSITLAATPPLPAWGGKFCDATFGTEVMRISDGAGTAVWVDDLGQRGFNKDSTKLAINLSSGNIEVYSLDPNALSVVGTGGINLSPVVDSATNSNISVPYGASNAFWSGSSDADAPVTMLMASGMSYYKVNVTNNTATKLVDLSSLITSQASDYGVAYLKRCSASRDTSVIACSILLDNSVTIYGKPARSYPRIGYVAFQILSTTPSNPATNFTVKAKFINGIDSANLATNQTVTLTSPSESTSYTYTLTSPYELGMDVHGGYKLAIDKSGRYVQFFAWEPSHLDSDYVDTYNPSVILDLVALAASSQPFSFQQAGGHGDIGTGFEVQQTTYNGTCVTCFKRWDLASLSSDPSPFVNNGTQISSALGYSYGRQYTSLYATAGTTASIVLACPVGGCISTPTVYSDEVINMPTDGSAIAGSGITRLVVSFR